MHTVHKTVLTAGKTLRTIGSCPLTERVQVILRAGIFCRARNASDAMNIPVQLDIANIFRLQFDLPLASCFCALASRSEKPRSLLQPVNILGIRA